MIYHLIQSLTLIGTGFLIGLIIGWESGGKKNKPIISCQAGSDGECNYARCPQTRDNEPETTGRHCPLDCDNQPE